MLVKTFIASASELQSSDLYMTVKATLFTVPEANLNGVRCTHDFLSEIVDNQEKYIGLPLCADVKNLANGQYEKLGHCYNAVTGTFSTSMIGSFYRFEAVANEDGSEALVGYARILKRNKAVCKAIGELFAEGALKFSFEINCGSYEELEDKTILIDKADNNYLEGMCVVSFPACPEAVALQLVAEIEACNKDLTKEAEHMPNEETVVAEETTAEKETQQETAEVKEEEVQVAESKEQEDPEEKKDEPEENKENAEVRIVEEHTEINQTTAYDTETGDEISERVTHEVTTYSTAEEDTSKEEPKEENAECKDEDEKKKASVEDAIAELRKELAEMQANVEDIRKLFAEQEKKISETVNPFMAEINQPKKYSLLEEQNTMSQQHYSLLDPM